MPQPYKRQTEWKAFPEAAKERPKLAEHMGIIISMWAHVELRMGYLLSSLLRQDSVYGVAMYLAIKSEPARLSVLRAAAESRLDDTQFKRFTKLLERIDKTGEQRNNIAHGIWAVPSDTTDSLLWMDARLMARNFSMSHRWIALDKPGTSDHLNTPQYRKLERDRAKSTFVYRERDFVDIEKRIAVLLSEINDFSKELQPPPYRPPARRA